MKTRFKWYKNMPAVFKR